MSRNVVGGDIVRRSIEMPPKTDERIKWLMDELEATSATEVIRRSLQVLETLIRDERLGRKLYVEDELGHLVRVTMRYGGMGTANEPPRPAKVVALNGQDHSQARNQAGV